MARLPIFFWPGIPGSSRGRTEERPFDLLSSASIQDYVLIPRPVMFFESFVDRSGSELHRIDIDLSTEFTGCCLEHHFLPRRTLMRRSMFYSPCKTPEAFRHFLQCFGRVPFLHSVAVYRSYLALGSHFDCSTVDSSDEN